MFIPTLLYGSETWTLTVNQERRIEAAEMRLLRPLAGYRLLDYKTNQEIREQLKVTGILDKLQQYRREWHQHLLRMDQHRIPRKMYNYQPQGNRSIGRPMKRWLDQL